LKVVPLHRGWSCTLSNYRCLSCKCSCMQNLGFIADIPLGNCCAWTSSRSCCHDTLLCDTLAHWFHSALIFRQIWPSLQIHFPGMTISLRRWIPTVLAAVTRKQPRVPSSDKVMSSPWILSTSLFKYRFEKVKTQNAIYFYVCHNCIMVIYVFLSIVKLNSAFPVTDNGVLLADTMVCLTGCRLSLTVSDNC
jgi:hypothetical protein